jgi:chromosome segregation ATPase
MITRKSTTSLHKVFLLLYTFAFVLLTAGCKETKTKKAGEEAAQAKMELVKAKADIIQLKGEVGYLKDRLKTTEQVRDKLQQQLDDTSKQHDNITGDNQQEIDKLKAVLIEQTKKTIELQKQVDQLKAVIRELQTLIEQKPADKLVTPGQEVNQSPLVSTSETNQ